MSASTATQIGSCQDPVPPPSGIGGGPAERVNGTGAFWVHDKYHGRVHWGQMSKKADASKLPKVRTHTDAGGNSTLCHNNLLGICPFGSRCERVESHGVRLTDKQAESLVEAVRPGVEHLMAHEPHFAPRRKAGKRPFSQ